MPNIQDWSLYSYEIYNTINGHRTGSEDYSTVPLLAQASNPWIEIGKLEDIEVLSGIYPYTEYQYGVAYNSIYFGFVHPVTINSWNTGIRISTIWNYPMGDTPNPFFNFGKIIFTKGINGSLFTVNSLSDWYLHYRYIRNYEYHATVADGIANNVTIYVRSVIEDTMDDSLENHTDLFL